MKPSLFWSFIFGVILAAMPFVGGYAEPSQTAPEPSVAMPIDDTGLAAADDPAESDIMPDVEAAPITGVTNAAVEPGSNEKPLPAHVRPTGPVVEVIRLAESGLDEGVMLAYVTNSTSIFNLGPEEIIYLNDIGVPSAVVTAMIQRDQVLRNHSTGLTAVQPATSAPPGPPLPPPDQVAPQPAQMTAAYPPEPVPQEEPVAEGGFYDTLAPYGNWVDVGGYGWCWQPTVVNVNRYWQPYFDCGHWVYTDCGWYWYSDYSWGWAPFHYGRWFRHHQLGWCWMPDNMWGPSWVSWRYTDAYCGWAPLPPGASLAFGVGLTFHGHHVGDHDDCGLRPDHYHFVAWNHFHDRQLGPNRLSSKDAAHVFDRSTVATRVSGDGHTVINHGLPPTRVVAATRTPVHTVTLRESQATSHAGRGEQFDRSGRTLQVFRPQLPANTASGSTTPAGTSRPHSSVNPRTPSTSAEAKAPGNGRVSARNIEAGQPGSSGPPIARIAPHDPSHLQQNPPLVLHGSQPWAPKESPAPSSLVIIGRRDANGRPIGSTTVTGGQVRQDLPATTTQRFMPARQNADVVPATVPQSPGARPANQNWQRNTPWLDSQNMESSPRFNTPSPASRPDASRYQGSARSTYPEVPRYNAPAFAPQQRSYSPPAMPQSRAPVMDSRPAPPAPSAPSAPAAAPARSAPAPSAPAQSAPAPAGRNTR
jgi:hypothetical protein